MTSPSYGSNDETKNAEQTDPSSVDFTNTESTPLLGKTDQTVFEESVPNKQRSFWSLLIFGWFTPLLERGNAKKRLDQNDLELIPLPDDCETRHVSEAFDRHWKHQVENSEHPSLLKALAYAFGRDFLRAGALKLVHDLCVFVGPQVLHGMIVFLRNPESPVYHGLLFTVAVTVSQLTMSLCLRHYFFKCYATGLRVRSAVVMAVYRKALLLSAGERQTRTLGEITNLMSIDAQRLQELCNYLHALWYSPLQIALALFFLWRQLGYSSLGGVFVIVIMIPVTKTVAQWMGTKQKALMHAKDRRVELNSEVLSNMKIIKFQAWEEAFQDRIMWLRKQELQVLLQYFFGLSVSRMFWSLTPLLVALATFTVYVWSGHQLDVASALTSLSLFDILRFPLFMLPQIINNTVEAMVAVGRVEAFLNAQEHVKIGPSDLLREPSIRLAGVTAAYESKKPKVSPGMDDKERALNELEWEKALLQAQLEDTERQLQTMEQRDGEDTLRSLSMHTQENGDRNAMSLLCLRRIDFTLEPGELVAVVGSVGCGKTSFLNAILGEVKELRGETAVRGSLSYFSQTPFIMNATLRDNILFGHLGEEVDEKLYQRALSCCALTQDLELLEDGDMTEIGEKGITLSGGQKARVALARAVYHRADCTLIDDALSAVDAHVAKELFEEAILNELLCDPEETSVRRSVILVTNALQYLHHPRVNRIVVIQDGAIAEQGCYEDLASRPGSVFARFLSVIQQTGVSKKVLKGGPEDAVGTMVGSEADPVRIDASAAPLKKPAKLMTEEARMVGHVNPRVYLTWANAAGGILAPIGILIGFTVTEAVTVLSSWWLTYWSGHATPETQSKFLGVYALINLSSAVANFGRMVFLVVIGLRASRSLFDGLLAVVLRAPMSFYDTTPVGRIMNRFSKDIYTVDEALMSTMRTYLQTFFNVISTIVVISAITPVFTLCLIPIILYYALEQAYFTLTYRELKRLDSVNRSPIYALLGETVDGVATIRAFGAEKSLLKRLIGMLNRQQHAYFLTCTAQSWLAVRLELIGTLIITFSCLSATLEHIRSGADENFAGLAGLAISYALSVTQSLNWSVRMASDLEANFVAVERIKEYTEIESEAERHTETDDDVGHDWPTMGEIVFKGAALRYRPELPLVLKGLDIKIPAKSKVGVVGRTGAGKSTLMVSLMRIVELSDGKLLIDGQDIRALGLVKLRKNISVIPQDPVLFSGSVRSNLDPFDEFADHVLLETLSRTGLYANKHSTASLSSLGLACVQSLEDQVSEGGINFSVGQRQLLVIARALLRGAKIVIMDEATAAVDAETDKEIQKVMRTEFADATCITVAHRLNTIMDSDLILVMSNGKAKEFDTPTNLLKKGGMFRDLVKSAATSD